MTQGIIRPQTEREKDMTQLDSEGNTTGFIDITEKVPDDSMHTIIQQINNRNRSILLDSKSPLDSLRALSCATCYQTMQKNNELEDMTFKQVFTKFIGRLELDKVIFREIKAKFTDKFEVSATIRFHRCKYCGKKHSIGFTNLEMTKEAFEELKKSASEHTKTDIGKW